MYTLIIDDEINVTRSSLSRLFIQLIRLFSQAEWHTFDHVFFDKKSGLNWLVRTRKKRRENGREIVLFIQLRQTLTVKKYTEEKKCLNSPTMLNREKEKESNKDVFDAYQDKIMFRTRYDFTHCSSSKCDFCRQQQQQKKSVFFLLDSLSRSWISVCN